MRTNYEKHIQKQKYRIHFKKSIYVHLRKPEKDYSIKQSWEKSQCKALKQLHVILVPFGYDVYGGCLH